MLHKRLSGVQVVFAATLFLYKLSSVPCSAFSGFTCSLTCNVRNQPVVDENTITETSEDDHNLKFQKLLNDVTSKSSETGNIQRDGQDLLILKLLLAQSGIEEPKIIVDMEQMMNAMSALQEQLEQQQSVMLSMSNQLTVLQGQIKEQRNISNPDKNTGENLALQKNST